MLVDWYCFRCFSMCVSRSPDAYIRIRKIVEFKFYFHLHHVCPRPMVFVVLRNGLGSGVVLVSSLFVLMKEWQLHLLPLGLQE